MTVAIVAPSSTAPALGAARSEAEQEVTSHTTSACWDALVAARRRAGGRAVIGSLARWAEPALLGRATVSLGRRTRQPAPPRPEPAGSTPASVGQVINDQSVDNTVANLCHTKRRVPEGDLDTGGQRRLTKSGSDHQSTRQVSVQAKKGKIAACAANGLADEVVKKLGDLSRDQRLRTWRRTSPSTIAAWTRSGRLSSASPTRTS